MIIVTGGAGLIGSAVVAELNQMGREDIIIVDNLRDSIKWQNLRALRYADYYEKDHFLQLIEEDKMSPAVSVIIHLGACSSTTESDASYLIRNNFEYSKSVLKYASRHGVQFVYASSAATYGGNEELFIDDEDALDELRPLNMYGYSKHLFDQWVKRSGYFTEDGKSPGVIALKFSNVFGANERHKAHMRSVIMRAYEQISADGKLKLFKSYRDDYADGEQVRDFIYVKDAAKMTLFFLDHPHLNGIFNIGFGATRSWNDLAKAAFSALKKPVDIEYIDMPDDLKERYQYFTQLDISKIREAGYHAELCSLEDAIEDYICNYMIPNKFIGD